MKKTKLATLIISSVIGINAVATHAADKPAVKPVVKPVQCYGIALKGRNDCGTPRHACAGMAETNNNPEEWVYKPNAADCNQAGGSLTRGKVQDEEQKK